MILPLLFSFPTSLRVAAILSWIAEVSRRLAASAAAIAMLCSLEVSAQTFVTEWNAAAAGRVGPTGMLVTTEGGVSYLYVSDQPRGRILKFNASNGTVVAMFGQVGDGSGDLNSPYGLARDPATGDIYVAER